MRSAKATHMRVRVGTDGALRASIPMYTPLLFVKKMISSSRSELRSMLEEHQAGTIFKDGMRIGKSHTITVRPTHESVPAITRHGQQILVSLPENHSIESAHIQALIRPVVIAALRKEAKSYLPRRLAHLAKEHGFSYERVRFSHAAGRWGSCSSSGTISLNIALMKLPFPLIDYVLLHELSHTVEMNHSSNFWALVERCEPHYKALRRQIKAETPSI